MQSRPRTSTMSAGQRPACVRGARSADGPADGGRTSGGEAGSGRKRPFGGGTADALGFSAGVARLVGSSFRAQETACEVDATTASETSHAAERARAPEEPFIPGRAGSLPAVDDQPVREV